MLNSSYSSHSGHPPFFRREGWHIPKTARGAGKYPVTWGDTKKGGWLRKEIFHLLKFKPYNKKKVQLVYV